MTLGANTQDTNDMDAANGETVNGKTVDGKTVNAEVVNGNIKDDDDSEDYNPDVNDADEDDKDEVGSNQYEIGDGDADNLDVDAFFDANLFQQILNLGLGSKDSKDGFETTILILRTHATRNADNSTTDNWLLGGFHMGILPSCTCYEM